MEKQEKGKKSRSRKNKVEKQQLNPNPQTEVLVESKESKTTDVTDVEKLFFAEVEKVPSVELMPDYDFCSYNSSLIKVIYEDRKVIVNACSDNYLLFPNKDLFPKIEDELKKVYKNVSIRREVKNNSQFYVDYSFTDNKKGIENDILAPCISIQNSYNGKLNYGVSCGLFNLTDESRLSIEQDTFDFDFSLSHCENNLEKIIANTLEGISQFLKSDEIIDSFNPLLEAELQENEVQTIVERVLDNTKVLLSLKEEIVERIKQKNTSKVFNLWTIYSGINYFLQPNHNEWLNASSDARRRMDKKVLEFIFSEVQ